MVVVYRAIAPVLEPKASEDAEAADRRALVTFYMLSAIFVVAFFGFGLFYGRGTHLTIADYWHWFVVHIWVESIFELFGVAVISLFLTGLLPIGLYQAWYSYDVGFWFARSAAFYESPVIQTLGTWRIVPDTTIIVLGAFPLLYFLITTYPRLRRGGEPR